MRRYTNSEFVEKLAGITNTVIPLEEYKNSSTKILFKCTNCGHEWMSKPNNVLNKHFCPKCVIKSRTLKETGSVDKLIAQLKHVNPNIKIIGKTYVNNKTPIECECLICGNRMKKRPDSLLSGRGCKICAIKHKHDIFSFTQDEFVERMGDINPDIDVVGEYNNNSTDIELRCKICGYMWKTKPINIMYKGRGGCPRCCASKGEKTLIKILDNYHINYKKQFVFDDCFYKCNLRFDAYDIENNIAYEYQGEQHYMPIDFGGHGDECAIQNYETNKIRDDIKRRYCEKHSIPLIEIPYWEKDNMTDFLINKWNELNLNIA